jgi:flavin-binding protein dodecin
MVKRIFAALGAAALALGVATAGFASEEAVEEAVKEAATEAAVEEVVVEEVIDRGNLGRTFGANDTLDWSFFQSTIGENRDRG